MIVIDFGTETDGQTKQMHWTGEINDDWGDYDFSEHFSEHRVHRFDQHAEAQDLVAEALAAGLVAVATEVPLDMVSECCRPAH